MTQHYTTTGIGIVEAREVEGVGEFTRGEPGYGIQHSDGSIYWLAKEKFEAAYLPLGHIGDEPGHLQRMRAEHAQLEHRYDKLCAFIGSEWFNVMGVEDRGLLEQQAKLMLAYLNTLNQRIQRAYDAFRVERIAATTADLV
ncbi:MAG TPA: hypothetical protein PKZ27_03165 [Rhodocyclaceae bacterium]|nr:hypothetical protein [Rhodocyclaceae bacterium]